MSQEINNNNSSTSTAYQPSNWNTPFGNYFRSIGNKVKGIYDPGAAIGNNVNKGLFGSAPTNILDIIDELKKLLDFEKLPANENYFTSLSQNLKQMCLELEKLDDTELRTVDKNTPVHQLSTNVESYLSSQKSELDLSKIQPAIKHLEKIHDERTGQLEKATQYFTGFIATGLREAYSSLYTFQSSLRAVISNDKPDTQELSKLKQQVGKLIQAKDRDLLGLDDVAIITPSQTLRYTTFKKALQELSNLLENKNPKYREKLKEVDQLTVGMIVTSEGQLRAQMTGMVEKLVNPNNGAIEQVTENAKKSITNMIDAQFKRPSEAALSLRDALPLLKNPNIDDELKNAIFEELSVFGRLPQDSSVSTPLGNLYTEYANSNNKNELVDDAIKALNENYIAKQTGAIPRAIGQMSEEAPASLLKAYSAITALLQKNPTDEEITIVAKLTALMVKEPAKYFKTDLSPSQKQFLTTLNDKLSSAQNVNNNNPLNIEELKPVIRQVRDLLDSQIAQKQGAAMQLMFQVKKGLFDPESGISHQVQTEFSKFVDSLFKRANGTMLDLQTALERLTKPHPDANDLQKARFYLKKLKDTPKEYIGRNWKQNETININLLIGNLGIDDTYTALDSSKSLIQRQVLPQVKKLIQEQQGTIHTQIEQITEHLTEKFSQETQRIVSDLTRQPQEHLGIAYQNLHAYELNPIKNKKLAKDTVNTLLSNIQKTFNPSKAVDIDEDEIKKNLTATQKTLNTDQPNLETVKATITLLKTHINDQSGAIYRITQNISETAQKKFIQEPMQNLMEQIQAITGNNTPQNNNENVNNNNSANNQTSNTTNTNPQNNNENVNNNNSSNNQTETSPVKRLFSGAIGMVTNMATHFGEAATKQALAWPANQIITFLRTAHGKIDGLHVDEPQKTLYKTKINQAIQKIETAKTSGSIQEFKTALEEAKAALSQFPILINGMFELPDFNTGRDDPLRIQNGNSEVSGPTVLDLQRQMLTQLNTNNNEHIDTFDWARETDREKDLFDKNASYMCTFKFIEWVCGQKDPKQEIDDRIEREIQGLSGTTYLQEKERLRQDYGYYNERVEDRTFYTIARAASTPDDFIRLVKEYIDRRSNDVPAVTRFIAKLILPLILKAMNFVVSKFSTGAVGYLREQIRDVELQPLKPVNSEPLSRITAWFQEYLNLQKAYANNRTNTHDKETFVRILMDHPDFNHGFEGDEIYKEFSKTIVDELLPKMDWTSWISKASNGIAEWKTKEVVDKASGASGLNYLAVPFKWVFGSAVQLTMFTGKMLLKIPEAIANFTLKTGLKQFLVGSNVLKTMNENAKHSTFEETPYTYTMDKALLEQLKEVYRVLQTAGSSEESDPGPQFDNVKSKLHELLKTVIRVVETRGLQAPDELRDLLEGPDSMYQQLNHGVFNLVEKDVIESTSRLIFIVYKTLLSPNNMEKQTAQAFKLCNNIITVGDNGVTENNHVLTDEEKRLRQLEFQRTKEEVEYYKDTILFESISQSVDRTLKQFGRAKQEEANKVIIGVKEDFLGTNENNTHKPGLIEKFEGWQQEFRQNMPPLSGPQPSLQIKTQMREKRLEILSQMKVEIERVTVDLNNKLMTVERNANLGLASKDAVRRVIRNATEDLNKILSSFNSLNNVQVNQHGKEKALPYLQAALEGVKTFTGKALIAQSQGFSESDINEMRSQLTQIITGAHSELKKISPASQKLQEFIRNLDVSELEKTLDTFNKDKILREQFTAMQTSSPNLIEQLAANRKDQIEQGTGILHGFVNIQHRVMGHQDPYETSKKEMQKLINEIPETLDRTAFNDLLSKMNRAQNAEEVNQLQSQFSTTINEYKERNTALIQIKCTDLDRLQSRLETLCDNLITLAAPDTQLTGTGQLSEIEYHLRSLKSKAQNIKKLEAVDITLFNQDGFVSFVKNQIFKEMKKRSDETLEVMRDPVMAEGLIRHLFLYNFVESHGGDRRRIEPPPAYNI